MKKTQLIMVLMFALMLPALAAHAETVPGQIIEVMDGDTLRVWLKHKIWGDMVRKLRLESIDTPEKRQAYGPEARDYCASLCLNKPVVVELTGRKTFDRLVARVRLRDGRDLARVMIENGMAWHYGKFSKDKSLAELQAKAKEKRLGLWSQAAPMPPWKWRKSKKRSRK